ncbi:PilZ domain-containing protein [Bdellovibrio sp. 22V]|uniref:PilZ domain-containing protein n=1 Tax=Bdellovibrio TaxID=958 RepID=UPI0025432898|nr:PilZ domain-containing protein [Bdellovibrio sp. 22V]WII72218.1 PilZ domain-containing protein [Bdellovibrio sp. 22V]
MKTQGKVWIIYDAESKTQTKPMSVVQAQVALLSLANKDPGKYFLWTPGWENWVCVREFLESDQKYFAIVQPPAPNELPGVSDNTLTATHNAPATNGGADSPYTQVVVGDLPIKPTEVGGYHAKDFNGDELDLAKIKKMKPEATKKKTESAAQPQQKAEPSGADRRRDPRHNFKIEVVLVSKIRSFRTYSKNISLSGTMLEDEIPKDFLNKPFDLIIVNPFESDPAKARLLFRAKIVGDLTDPRRLMFIEQDVAMTLRLDALLKAYVAYQNQLRQSAG